LPRAGRDPLDDQARLPLTWSETGGPAVLPPSRKVWQRDHRRNITRELGARPKLRIRTHGCAAAAFRASGALVPSRCHFLKADHEPAAILIVQDDFLAGERLRLLLVQGGYDVVGVAGRTSGAVDLAKQHRPDLAIVDMMLELDVDGIRTVTELARRFNMRILITTGFPDSVIQATCGSPADRQAVRGGSGSGRPLPGAAVSTPLGPPPRPQSDQVISVGRNREHGTARASTRSVVLPRRVEEAW
jgi:CheY-like chemotaxis protein